MMRLLAALFGLALSILPAAAQFPAAQHGKGTLEHDQSIPILTVRGTPKEIGEQFGILAIKNAPGIMQLHQEFLADAKLEESFPAIKILAERLKNNLPAEYRTEMDAMASVSGVDPGILAFSAAVYDLSSGLGCSTIVVEPSRSSTGGPLFARNLDWLPTKSIPGHTLVAVYHPTGKHAFATVTISPVAGCISGMNDAGLCCTINEIFLKDSRDKAGFNWAGIPMLMAFRRVLEECTTVAEAEALLRTMKRTTSACMTICDPNGGAVLEITPKTIVARNANNGVTCCTNHFCCDALTVGAKCRRLPKLLTLQASQKQLAPADLFERLHAVHQDEKTLQAMVFEPAALKIHLKLGDAKASATTRETVVLDLGARLKPSR